MKKILIPSMLMLAIAIGASAQSPLPVREWTSATDSAYVLYFSGDGGFNSFSITLCNNINSGGYPLTAVNSKTYFWDKRTPQQTADAVAAYLHKQLPSRRNQEFVLVGYSFGADVMPFIVNRLDSFCKSRLRSVVLISPSTSTDFEIHWSDMFGSSARRSMDVVAEINRMSARSITTFFGTAEGDFPVSQLHVANYRNQTLPGGHRYDGHVAELAKRVMASFR